VGLQHVFIILYEGNLSDEYDEKLTLYADELYDEMKSKYGFECDIFCMDQLEIESCESDELFIVTPDGILNRKKGNWVLHDIDY